MSRILRLLSVFAATVAALSLPATAALAQVPPPDPSGVGQPAPTTTTIVRTVAASGLSMWATLAIAAAAIVLGGALAELVHVARRRDRHQLATA